MPNNDDDDDNTYNVIRLTFV